MDNAYEVSEYARHLEFLRKFKLWQQQTQAMLAELEDGLMLGSEQRTMITNMIRSQDTLLTESLNQVMADPSMYDSGKEEIRKLYVAYRTPGHPRKPFPSNKHTCYETLPDTKKWNIPDGWLMIMSYFDDDTKIKSKFYQYCRQHDRWLETDPPHVTLFDLDSEEDW